jgi:hypothetical protein
MNSDVPEQEVREGQVPQGLHTRGARSSEPPPEPEDVRRRRLRKFYYVRLALLMAAFLAVVAWAWNDIRERRERNAWVRPLHVGFVLLRTGSVNDATIDKLRLRMTDLQTHLSHEFQRWRSVEQEPFIFSVYGPLDVATPPPESYSDKWWDLLYFAYQQWRYLKGVDAKADVPRSELDSRIYVVVRPPNAGELQFVEGQSEQGGRVGVVGVQLDESMVDFSLIVATHELMHTLGASDKYDEYGHALVPDGLAEPDKIPPFPQQYFEVMARNRPISPEAEEPPESLEQLRIGRKTAEEIGWVAAPGRQ